MTEAQQILAGFAITAGIIALFAGLVPPLNWNCFNGSNGLIVCLPDPIVIFYQELVLGALGGALTVMGIWLMLLGRKTV